VYVGGYGTVLHAAKSPHTPAPSNKPARIRREELFIALSGAI